MWSGEAAEEAGIRFVAIPTGKLRRYLSLRNLTDAARLPLGVLAARRALAAFRPDVVLSTGGFVSVPAVVAARGIAPVLTHEQTAILGLANRINARFADVLAVSHSQTEPIAARLHRRVVVTGNPIRVGLTAGDRSRGLQRLGFDGAIPVVYVTGGARGASPINQRIAALLPGILDHAQIVHQTGPLSANADAGNLSQLREVTSGEPFAAATTSSSSYVTNCPMSTPPPISSSDEPAREPSPSWHMSACPRFSYRFPERAAMSRR